MPTLNGPRLDPLNGASPRNLVILLHGYGADGDDLIGLANYWQRDFPHTVFVAPHAPEPCELSPFGRQWFSLEKYDPDLHRRDPKAAATAFEQMIDGAKTASLAIDQFLGAEMARLSFSFKDVAFVGFSQGTMLSLYTGLREAEAPAGILGYSGALIGAERLATEIRCRPPVCLVHGENDEMVPFASLAHAASALKAADIPTVTHARPGLGHGIDEKGLEIGREFLKSIFI
ncbi:MAG: phospholipase [Sneathiella sp.]|nr:MAG: phospholipase [Sneathiella sp.]